MIIRLDDIPPEGLEVSLSEHLEGVPAVLRELSGDDADHPLSGRLFLTRIAGSDMVVPSGTVETDVVLRCDRCLESVRFPLKGQFGGLLQPASALPPVHAGAEVELGAEELDISFFGPGGIRVSDLIREQLLLAVPGTVLCRADCKGICQQCGAELNREPCRCKAAVVDSRWGALKDWKKGPDS